MNSHSEAYESFAEAVTAARSDSDKKSNVGPAFRALCAEMKLTPEALCRRIDVGRATSTRWAAGRSIPHPSHMSRIREVYLGVEKGSDEKVSVAESILAERNRPIIKYALEVAESGTPLTEEQLRELLWLAEKSKGGVTPEMIEIFLGRVV